MKKQVFSNMTVMVIADNDEQVVRQGKLTPANVLVKEQDEMVVMPHQPYKHAAHNPLLYEGEFFSSRQKQNGNISLHGLITGETNLCQAYNTARKELDEFFTKMGALL